mmetsp:Transcript_6822/g.15830  ORF Transcript_6822/g.15830 Transcript_6822/m.15830 type:complete len:388 (+) Transcript_6822:936-2099(+)
MLLDILANVFDAVVKSLEELEVLPARLGEPGIGARLFGLLEARVALHVEVELFLVQVVVAVQNHGRHLEAEEKLMPFEDTHACVVVHGLRHFLPKILEAVVNDLVRLRITQRCVEDAEVAAQGVLVHLTDRHHSRHGEVQDRAALCNTDIEAARLLNLLRSFGSGLERLSDLNRLGLCVVQSLNELVVVQDTALGGRELPQQGVLQALDDLSVVGHLLHKLLAHLLEVRPLEANDDVQELRRQTLQRDDAVHNGSFAHHLRSVLRVAELRRHVQHEGFIPLQLIVTERDHPLSVHQNNLLLEHGINHGIELLIQILEQEGLSVLDSQFQELHVLVIEGLDGEAGLLLLLLQPRHDLHLGVHAQGPARGSSHEDAVLDAKLICGQPVP